MRIHPFCLLLIVGWALVAAATRTNCIIGCKCDGHTLSRKLKIQECDSPLVLTKKALSGVSKKIAAIGFKNVVIKRFDNDTFQEFNELDSVTIEDASIDFIHPSTFDLPELGTITFMRTTFGESPRLISEYLEELIFNDCKLSQVPNLDRLPALSFLNLANNLIKTIDEKTFNKVASLEEVTLANNSITRLPPNLFENNSDFNVLNLDDNPLTTFKFDFPSGLEFLSLKNCKLSTFDRFVTENLNLVSTLDLSGNKLAVLPIDAFEPMKDLNAIDLSNNKLVELDDNIFYENTRLDKIVLDNNELEVLPNFQAKTKTFQTFTFSCKNCGLISVKGAFENMRALVSIDLSNNKLEEIDGVFSEINGIKQIFLSNNKITTIGINSFGTNSELETLDLSSNPLSPLDPVVLASVPMLKSLNVSDCSMKTLWANHNALLPNLEKLYLANNQLSSITSEDMKILPKLRLIELHDNPLTCTDDLLHFVDYLMKESIYPNEIGVKTHEKLISDAALIYNPKRSWQSVLPPDCLWDDDDNELSDDDDDDDDDDPDYDGFKYEEEKKKEDTTEDDDDNEDEDTYDDIDTEDVGVEASILNTNGFNLAKASYVLSITSVFILTALLVLFVAVAVTLLILKKNKSFNMHNGNLPRLKIPLWHTTPGQKKHSGSVYRPLSEELSGSRTPIINRYDFKQTPQVHNSQP